jgi:hypothetical protein
MEQRCRGTLQVWAEPFVPLRLCKIFNLRTDPFERADITSNAYWEWLIENCFIVYPAQAIAAEFINTFKEFPPAQKAATFTLGDALEKCRPSEPRAEPARRVESAYPRPKSFKCIMIMQILGNMPGISFEGIQLIRVLERVLD